MNASKQEKRDKEIIKLCKEFHKLCEVRGRMRHPTSAMRARIQYLSNHLHNRNGWERYSKLTGHVFHCMCTHCTCRAKARFELKEVNKEIREALEET